MRNSSTVECTLQGEVPTTMLAGGREIPMLYAHGIDEQGRTAGAPAGRRPRQPPPGLVRSVLSAREGVVGALLSSCRTTAAGCAHRSPPTPASGCPTGGGGPPPRAGALSASAFTEPVTASKPPSSPLEKLTVAVQGPTTAAAGSRLTFQVTLVTRPTAPRWTLPGYLMERFSLATRQTMR